MIKVRPYAVEIVELFNKHGIIITDEDRTRIEADVRSVLCGLILRVKSLPDADFDIESL